MIRLAWAGLRHHRRVVSGVVLGVALTTALLVGGLAMGDSLTAALRQRTASRLGPVTVAIERPGNGLTLATATALGQVLQAPVAGVLSLPAVAASPQGQARQVRLLGADAALATMAGQPDLVPPPGSVRLDASLARRLGVVPGDRVTLRAERPGALSRDVALTRDADAVVGLSAEVGPLLDGRWPTDLALDVTPGDPDVVLVDATWLRTRLGQTGDPRVDQVLVAGPDATTVQRAVAQAWTLADADLDLMVSEGGEHVLSTPRILLADAVAEAAAAVPDATPALVWFFDQVRHDDRSSPYGFVAAIPNGSTAAVAEVLPAGLGDDEIVLTDWLADDLRAAPGDTVVLRYPELGAARDVTYGEHAFTVAAVVPVDGATADPSWMPPIEGMAGEKSCRAWDPGLPVDLDRIRDTDEAWWLAHGGTPKAWIRLSTGQALWSTPHGRLTSVRWPARTDADAIASALRAHLSPGDAGLRVLPVKEHLVASERPANDFGQLFAGFQAVLLFSALLLTALQAAFVVEGRARELGVLRAVGWTRGRVTSLLLLEGACVATAGVVLGLPAAWGVAAVWRAGLDGVWSTATTGVSLPLALSASTVAIGAVAAWAMALGAMAWTAWRLLRADVRPLLVDAVEPQAARAARWPVPVMVIGALGAAAVVATTPAERTPEAALRFFAAGGLVLLAGLGQARWWLGRAGGDPLGPRAASRRPRRSLSVVTLLALGAFLVAGVGLGGGRAEPDPADRASGSGGFAWVGDTTLPVNVSVASAAGRQALGLPDDLPGVDGVVPLSRVDGDDASCLQLGAAQAPTLLGVDPTALSTRGAFALLGGATWDDLTRDLGPHAIAAVGDTATVTWGLHLGVGDAVTWTDDHGELVDVVIVGTVASSVFQGSLLVDRDALVRHFPHAAGARTFLVDGPDADAVASGLASALGDRGAAFEPTSERLHRYAAVEDTYIAIFRALGGMGLVLGALGVGLVLVRGVQERRGELALLRAVGFTRPAVGRLLVREHLFLVALGLVYGTVAAVVAVVPILATPGVQPPVGEVAAILALTGAVAAAAVVVATRRAVAGVPLAELVRDRA